MSEVQFEEDQFGIKKPAQSASAPSSPAPNFAGATFSGGAFVPGAQNVPQFGSSEPKFNQWLIRHGLAKSGKSANTVLVAVIVINMIVTAVLLYFFL